VLTIQAGRIFSILAFFIFLATWTARNRSVAQESSSAIPRLGERLTDDQAAGLAKLAIASMQREFPNKPGNVITGPESILGPKKMHPAFYGCFDWHSSVHGHWMLVRLLKTNPQHPLNAESRLKLAENLTTENIIAETVYFDEKENKSFERMYGWAWLLRLVDELHTWDDPTGKEWRESLKPLESKIVELTKSYLPRLRQPVRTGVHPDTAFALGQILDYSRTVHDKDFEALIVSRSRDYYLKDSNYNAHFEPSGEDFFSQSLNEADLMRRVLRPEEFAKWFNQFLPELKNETKSKLLEPVEVSDVTDGKLVHLAGLDLSRAWCMLGIARGLPAGDGRSALLFESAAEHARVGLGYVFSGHYEGEHWLGTFAVYALTQ
jgi:Protein of unknown function (DUF2891)